jgi:hypothetical protein
MSIYFFVLPLKFTHLISGNSAATAVSLAALKQLSTVPLLLVLFLNFIAPAQAQVTTYELVCDSGKISLPPNISFPALV